MKTFIKKIRLFILLALIFFGLITLVFNYHLEQEINRAYQLKADTKILCLGDSHTECAINDSTFPVFENVAKSAETYFFTYFKLKRFLETEKAHNLKVICIGFNFFSLNEKREKLFIDKQQSNIAYFFHQTYLPVWRDLKNHPQNFGYKTKQNSITLLLQSYSFTLEKLKYYIKHHKSPYPQLSECRGRFLKLTESINDKKTESQLSRLKRAITVSASDEYRGSKLEENMLRLMLDLAKKHEIPVVLITTPEHPLQVKNTAQNEIDYHLNLIEDLKREYGIHFLNYNDMDLPHSYFFDFEHLNVKGANIFTPILLNDLKKLQLICPD